jgi:hypothetical protein
MKPVLALLLVVLAAGCTTRYVNQAWTKPGAAVNQTTLDDVQCLRDASAGTRVGDTVVGGLADLSRLGVEQRRRDRTYVRCMAGRGYQPAP